jgi:hypothetical protein
VAALASAAILIYRERVAAYGFADIALGVASLLLPDT